MEKVISGMKIHLPKWPQVISLILLAIVISCNATGSNNQKASAETASAEDTLQVANGKVLFNAHCDGCHSYIKSDNILVGVVERTGKSYLRLYLTKQDSLIINKDRYAMELKRAYGNLGNSHNFKFSDGELNALIAFLKMKLG